MSVQIYYKHGLRLLSKTPLYRKLFVVDPTSVRDISMSFFAFITHSHLDHSIAFPNANVPLYATELACKIYQILSSKKAKNVNFVSFFDPFFPIADVEVQFLPAGHLLGAAQILFKFPDLTVLYTGDLSVDKMITVPQASIPKEEIDILIIEATYGTPTLFFPPRDEIKISMLRWIADSLEKKRIPVINIGYSGPAQEIIAFLNQMFSIDIFVNQKTDTLNQLYCEEGINLIWKNYEKKLSEFNPYNSVVLLPRNTKNIPEFLKPYKLSRAIVTGQATRFSYSRFDQSFPFSMHANFHELLSYTKEINPKKVYTVYGFDVELAKAIRTKLRIPAMPLKRAGKNLTLQDFF
ncbi:MAG: hypothetical protein ACTSYD_14940 [Candidatus Heimdallarchaeaceae archaeon]